MAFIPKFISNLMKGSQNGAASAPVSSQNGGYAPSFPSASPTQVNSNIGFLVKPTNPDGTPQSPTPQISGLDNPDFLPFPPVFCETTEIKLGWLQNSLMRAAAYVQAQEWMDDYLSFAKAIKNGQYDSASDSVTVRPSAVETTESTLTLTQGGAAVTSPPKSAMETAVYVRLTRVLRSAREQIATLSQLNPNIFHTCFNPTFGGHVQQWNKRVRAWFEGEKNPVEKIKQCLQYASIFRAGYAFTAWSTSIFGADAPDLDIIPLAPGQVLPDGLPPDNNLDRATAVHIHLVYPAHELVLMFPDFANEILKPSPISPNPSGTNLISTQASSIMGVNNNLSRFGNQILQSFNGIAPDNRGTLNYSQNGMAGGAVSNHLLPVNMEGYNNRLVNVMLSFLPDTTVNSENDFRCKRIMELRPDLKDAITAGEFPAEMAMIGDASFIDRVKFHCDYKVASVQRGVESGLLRPKIDPMTQEQQIDPMTGEPMFEPIKRVAQTNEVMFYPGRRMVFWMPETNNIFYDGPSYFWHGKIPVEKFCLDPWPWKLNGGSMAAENLTLEEAAEDLLNKSVHSAHMRLNPPTLWDEDNYSTTEMQTYDLTKPGFKVRMKMKGADKKIEFPMTNLAIDPQAAEMVQLLLQMSDHQYGTNDLTSLARLQQVPSGDSIEKLLTAIGPLAMGQAQNVENTLVRLGAKVFWTILQFDTSARRLQLLGPSGLVSSDFDWTPGDLIPERVGIYGPEAGRYRRGIEYGRAFSFKIVRGSTFNITDVQQRLLLMQLWQAGFPIDPETIAKAWKLENFGEIKGDNILEKYYEFMNKNSKYAEFVQARAMQTMAQVQLKMQAQAQGMGLGETDQEIAPAAGLSQPGFNLDLLKQLDNIEPFQQTETRGRDYEGLTAPKLAQRDGGTRTTQTQTGAY